MDGLAFDDMDEMGRELDDPFAELMQDVVHILLEPFGSNPDVRNRGVGLWQALSGPASRIPNIKAQAESQLHDDERITSATVNITPTDARGSYAIDLEIVVAGGVVLTDSFVLDSANGLKRRTS